MLDRRTFLKALGALTAAVTTQGLPLRTEPTAVVAKTLPLGTHCSDADGNRYVWFQADEAIEANRLVVADRDVHVRLLRTNAHGPVAMAMADFGGRSPRLGLGLWADECGCGDVPVGDVGGSSGCGV